METPHRASEDHSSACQQGSYTDMRLECAGPGNQNSVSVEPGGAPAFNPTERWRRIAQLA